MPRLLLSAGVAGLPPWRSPHACAARLARRSPPAPPRPAPQPARLDAAPASPPPPLRRRRRHRACSTTSTTCGTWPVAPLKVAIAAWRDCAHQRRACTARRVALEAQRAWPRVQVLQLGAVGVFFRSSVLGSGAARRGRARGGLGGRLAGTVACGASRSWDCERFVGELSRPPAARALRVSTLNVWGNRKDRDIPIAQLASLLAPSFVPSEEVSRSCSCSRSRSRSRQPALAAAPARAPSPSPTYAVTTLILAPNPSRSPLPSTRNSGSCPCTWTARVVHAHLTHLTLALTLPSNPSRSPDPTRPLHAHPASRELPRSGRGVRSARGAYTLSVEGREAREQGLERRETPADAGRDGGE